MDIQKFVLFVPFEIDDIIQAEGYSNQYKILDIQYLYSAKEKTCISVYFELYDLELDMKVKRDFKDFNWKIIKQNDKGDNKE